MNYIVLSEKVETYLHDEYSVLCFEQKYIDSFDEYVNSIFHYGTEVRIFNRVYDETEYQIIGKGYYIRVSRHYSYDNSFFAYRIDKYRDNSKYLEMFSQTVALPGEWRLIIFDEGINIKYEKTTSINDFLVGLKGSYKEYYEFKERWELWDTYNSKLNELSEQRERESECFVDKVLLEHDVFVISLSEIKKEYREDAMVSVKTKGSERYISIGKILSIDSKQDTIEVAAINEEIIESHRNGVIGVIEKIRVTDYGTKARLRRQKDALKRLFDNETANINLKEILMGDFEYEELEVREDLIKSANGLFSTNLRQEQAFRNALSANDIYMIQGPPGTGKTTVITEIVKKIVGEGKTVLVSSETNIAVDNVLEKIEHHMGVIAVRLGKEERIGSRCQRFMPERIASVIRKGAIDLLEFRNNSKNTFEVYRQELEEKWKKKIHDVEQQIEIILKSLPDGVDYETLHKDILSYETNAKMLNFLYEDLMASKNEYATYDEILKNLKEDLILVEAQIKVTREEFMKSGFKSVDDIVGTKESELLKEKDRIEKEYIFTEKRIRDISYDNKSASYVRKNRRIDTEKKKLVAYVDDEINFVKEVFILKQKTAELLELLPRKKALESAMHAEIEEANISFNRDKDLLERSKEIREEWKGLLKQPTILDTFENLYLRKTNAVFATCTGIASSDNGVFALRDYDYVIVDEAAKCNMLDLLIPLVMGKKIILVGDHKQLYPMLEKDGLNEEITDEELQELKEHTLFKWLFEDRVPAEFKIMLNKQYRMPLDISQFASENFYNGELESEKQNTGNQCMFWIDIPESVEKQKGNSTSYYNAEEATAICKLMNKIDLSINKRTEVGVICIYKSQANYLSNLLSQYNYKNVVWECSTVDAFQGKEKSIIIFNTVRSASCNQFVSDSNRTNVAITRTKDLLYIVGNLNIVKHREAGVLKDLYYYISKKGAIYNKNYLEI